MSFDSVKNTVLDEIDGIEHDFSKKFEKVRDKINQELDYYEEDLSDLDDFKETQINLNKYNIDLRELKNPQIGVEFNNPIEQLQEIKKMCQNNGVQFTYGMNIKDAVKEALEAQFEAGKYY